MEWKDVSSIFNNAGEKCLHQNALTNVITKIHFESYDNVRQLPGTYWNFFFFTLLAFKSCMAQRKKTTKKNKKIKGTHKISFSLSLKDY